MERLRESAGRERSQTVAIWEWALLLAASCVFLSFGGLCLIVTLFLH